MIFRPSTRQFPLWPPLLLLALLLLPFDIAVRRLIVTQSDLAKASTWLQKRLGIQERHRVRQAASAQMAQLLSAKNRAAFQSPESQNETPSSASSIREVAQQRRTAMSSTPPAETPVPVVPKMPAQPPREPLATPTLSKSSPAVTASEAPPRIQHTQGTPSTETGSLASRLLDRRKTKGDE